MDNLQIELQIIYLTKLFLDLNMKLFYRCKYMQLFLNEQIFIYQIFCYFCLSH